MLDIHNHILTGLDDGPSLEEESLAMARMAVRDGISAVVCTPHWCVGKYNNSREIIMARVAAFQERLDEENIPLKVYPGAELRIDISIPFLLAENEILTFNDNGRYILLELPTQMLPENIDDFLWDLQVRKITPVIAHIERNTCLRQNPRKILDWISMGILTQVTAASILGKFGKETRKFSHFLLEHKMVHILATDAHGVRARRPDLAEGYEMLKKLCGKEPAHRMVHENPENIIAGKPLTVEDPIPLESEKRGGWQRLKSLFLNAFVLLLVPVFSACSSGPPVQKITHDGVRQVSHGRYRPQNEEAVVRVVSPETEKEAVADSRPLPGEQSGAVVRKIKSPDVTPAPPMRNIPLTYKAYILEKFRGKRVVFPEELAKEDSLHEPVYRIGIEDELFVAVWKNPDLSMAVVVSNDGKISVPLVGELKVQGLQISEMVGLLTKKLSQFVEAPQVSVNIKAINSRRVFITGAVKTTLRAGEPVQSGFTLRGDRRLLTSLSEVTLAEDADLEESYIVRGEVVIPLDLHRLIVRGDMTQNLLLQPSDTIVIPAARKEISILGEVNKPGLYKMKNRTTVFDVISVAEGIKDDSADLERAYIARQGKNYPVNVKKLLGGDIGLNVFLENKDVVYIPNDKDNKIFVIGEVKRPSVVKFTDSMDVLEAIASAGDFMHTANREQVVVVRGPRDNAEVYAIDALRMSRGYHHESFILQKSDLLFVPRTHIADWNIFISQLLPSASISNTLKNLGD